MKDESQKQNGKGDAPRPVDGDKYRKNYENIKWFSGGVEIVTIRDESPDVRVNVIIEK